MINPEVGDYVISTNKIYEITSIHKEGLQTFYNVVLVSNPADSLDWSSVSDIVNFVKTQGISLARLRHLGEVVKRQDASKAIEVLFKNS